VACELGTRIACADGKTQHVYIKDAVADGEEQ
jgi:hypothetical protein